VGSTAIPTRDGGVELRDQVGAAEFGGDFRETGQVVQFGVNSSSSI
jgi:hypothetical protein